MCHNFVYKCLLCLVWRQNDWQEWVTKEKLSDWKKTQQKNQRLSKLNEKVNRQALRHTHTENYRHIFEHKRIRFSEWWYKHAIGSIPPPFPLPLLPPPTPSLKTFVMAATRLKHYLLKVVNNRCPRIFPSCTGPLQSHYGQLLPRSYCFHPCLLKEVRALILEQLSPPRTHTPPPATLHLTRPPSWPSRPPSLSHPLLPSPLASSVEGWCTYSSSVSTLWQPGEATAASASFARRRADEYVQSAHTLRAFFANGGNDASGGARGPCHDCFDYRGFCRPGTRQ